MLGCSAKEMIGEEIGCLILADRQAEEDIILTRLARRECIECYETTLLARDGRAPPTAGAGGDYCSATR
jgi:hypothetical protein